MGMKRVPFSVRDDLRDSRPAVGIDTDSMLDTSLQNNSLSALNMNTQNNIFKKVLNQGVEVYV